SIAATIISTLSLHDALPILFLQSCCDVRFIETRRIRLAAPIKLGNPSLGAGAGARPGIGACLARRGHWCIGGSRRGGDGMGGKRDRKSKRLNSSHGSISYAV